MIKFLNLFSRTEHSFPPSVYSIFHTDSQRFHPSIHARDSVTELQGRQGTTTCRCCASEHSLFVLIMHLANVTFALFTTRVVNLSCLSRYIDSDSKTVLAHFQRFIFNIWNPVAHRIHIHVRAFDKLFTRTLAFESGIFLAATCLFLFRMLSVDGLNIMGILWRNCSRKWNSIRDMSVLDIC